MRKRQRCSALVMLLVWLMAVGPTQAGGFPVFDGANLTENIRQGYMQLKSIFQRARQIINEIKYIKNQLEMIKRQGKALEYQAKDLKSLKVQNVEMLVDAFFELDSVIMNTAALVQRIERMEERFMKIFPDVDLTRAVWQGHNEDEVAQLVAIKEATNTAMSSVRLLQANREADEARIKMLLEKSREAEGNLEAQQIQNELIAQLSKHLMESNALAVAALQQQAVVNAYQVKQREKALIAERRLWQDVDPHNWAGSSKKLPMLK